MKLPNLRCINKINGTISQLFNNLISKCRSIKINKLLIEQNVETKEISENLKFILDRQNFYGLSIYCQFRFR